MSKPSLGYEEDGKEQVVHLEGGLETAAFSKTTNVHDAAAAGHLATDARGKPLVEIDVVASKKLARKVRRLWS
jgi:hypothetical protein